MFVAAAISLFIAQASFAQTPRSEDFSNTCSERCLAKEKGAEHCAAYCNCMTREIFVGRSPSELDKFHAAMQPHAPDSSEKDVLKLLVGQCKVEASRLQPE